MDGHTTGILDGHIGDAGVGIRATMPTPTPTLPRRYFRSEVIFCNS